MSTPGDNHHRYSLMSNVEDIWSATLGLNNYIDSDVTTMVSRVSIRYSALRATPSTMGVVARFDLHQGTHTANNIRRL
jgi:hypothetical protein